MSGSKGIVDVTREIARAFVVKHVRRETSTRPLSHITCDSGRRVRPASRLLLQQLEQMMENLQMATPDMNGDDLGDMMQELDELGDMIHEQQDLRDRTFR